MKTLLLFIPALIFFYASLFAQCGQAACPAGAINTLPAGGLIAAGDTYCISGLVSNLSDYTINGTLIIQSGSVTVGNLTMGKTGSIIVNAHARFMANSYTGDATAPAAVISNVNVCGTGYLYLSGAINPGETNFTVADSGVFVIHGSWSTIIGDTYFKLGLGAVVEMCSSFVFKSSTGFFTETSTGVSYLVTRSAMANGAGTGYLSKSGAASNIHWDIPGGPVAWVSHPAANTCNGAACTLMLPPGSIDDGVCGSVALSLLAVLPLHAGVPQQSNNTPAGNVPVLVFPNPVVNAVYVTAPGDKFSGATLINCMGQEVRQFYLPPGSANVRCELPVSLPAGIYFIRLTKRGRAPITVRVLKSG